MYNKKAEERLLMYNNKAFPHQWDEHSRRCPVHAVQELQHASTTFPLEYMYMNTSTLAGVPEKLIKSIFN